MPNPNSRNEPSQVDDASVPFDPSKVPPYPVLTLIGTGNEVTVDGEPFEGEDAYSAALAYCAERADELGGAVRVRGVDEDGQDWPLVVTADGELHEVPAVAGRRRRSNAKSTPGAPMDRRRMLAGAALIGIASIGVIGVGGGGFYAWKKMHDKPAPPPPPKYPGRGAQLPILPPPGYAAQATWAVIVNDSAASPTVLPGGQLVVAAPDGAIVRLNAANGQQQWTGAKPRDVRGKYSVIDFKGQKFLSLASSGGLEAWPYATEGVAPARLTTDEAAKQVITSGAGGTLFVLADQSAQLLDQGSLTMIDIPVPALPAGRTKTHAIAVDKTAIIQISPGNEASRTALRDPSKDGTLVQARLLGADVLALIWKTPRGTGLTTHSLGGGDRLGGVLLPRGPSTTEEPLGSATGRTWAWNGALIREGKPAVLDTLAAKAKGAPREQHDLRPALVTDTHLWGTYGGTTVSYDINTAEMTVAADAATPAAVSDDESLAYVVTKKLGKQTLYALPATDGS